MTIPTRELINKVKKELNIEHDKELAELAGVKVGTLTQSIARNSFQYELLIPYLVSKGIDLNVIFSDGFHPDTKQNEILKTLETKYLGYQEYGKMVTENVDKDIQTLIEKYDGLIVVIKDIYKEEGILV